jgi:lipoate-protein ligase B
MRWTWWGESQPYGSTRERQLKLRAAIQRGEAEECIALLEHAPVITVGRRTAGELPDALSLQEAGIEFEETERGGLATYHGPGQLIAYALVDIHKRKIKVRCFVHALEEACIQFLSGHGVRAGRAEGAPGVWVKGKKIGAVGVHFSRGVSIHGLALNLDPNLEHFQWIQPCGFDAGAITSLSVCTQTVLKVSDVAPEFSALLINCIEEVTCA